MNLEEAEVQPCEWHLLTFKNTAKSQSPVLRCTEVNASSSCLSLYNLVLS